MRRLADRVPTRRARAGRAEKVRLSETFGADFERMSTGVHSHGWRPRQESFIAEYRVGPWSRGNRPFGCAVDHSRVSCRSSCIRQDPGQRGEWIGPPETKARSSWREESCRVIHESCATKSTLDPGEGPGVGGSLCERGIYHEKYFRSCAMEWAFVTLTVERRSQCMSPRCLSACGRNR